MDQFAGIQVLYDDPALLVVNKPAGIPTLPDGYDRHLPHIKSLLETHYGRLWIVHRLDKDTSGVLVLARSADAHRLLNAQFDQHQVTKVYHALVSGTPTWRERTLDLPLRPNGDRHHRTVVDPQNGKPATTHLKVLERMGDYCLVEARPETGRTHQIRAHLSACHLYIVGDRLYDRQVVPPSSAYVSPSGNRATPGPAIARGMALHARILEIDHPHTLERMKFRAPYPAEFEALLQHLRSLPADYP
ncbi:MAG: RluA family pseudouridine synthase [Acidobacteriaceae bacterium]